MALVVAGPPWPGGGDGGEVGPAPGAGAGNGRPGRRDRRAAGTTLLQRRVHLARVGAGPGRASRHRARRVFANAARQAELDQEFELRTAAQVAEALGNMKGAFMKLGQMASYLDIGLPPHVPKRWPA